MSRSFFRSLAPFVIATRRQYNYWLVALIATWAASALPSFSQDAPATASPPAPRLVEEVWGLPLILPSIAYVVHPAGKGPFPLVIMNHGVSMDPKQRSFFPLVEFRDAAFWFARRGYFVVAPAGPGYGGVGLDMPSVESMASSSKRSENAAIRIFVTPDLPSRRLTLRPSNIFPIARTS